jgi:hypothetical protein
MFAFPLALCMCRNAGSPPKTDPRCHPFRTGYFQLRYLQVDDGNPVKPVKLSGMVSMGKEKS